jgi:hypothetical protein
MKKENVNCRKCINYFITWDKKFPYGCKALNFKTNRLPSVDVKINSGLQCMLFKEKKIDK